MVVPGFYRHYKGKMYKVLGVARHSETQEEMVVYEAQYDSEFGTRALWVRLVKEFAEMVEIEGKKVPRFTLMERRKF